MQEIKGLLQRNIGKLKNKQWYHQRFDGAPMFIFAIAEAEPKKEKRKPKGTEGSLRVFFSGKDIIDWYIPIKDIERGSRKIIELAKKDAGISGKLMDKWKADEQKFENFFWKVFPKINLGKLSDRQLLKLWGSYYKLFVNRVTSSSIIDHFALGTDRIIGNMLRKETTESIKKESDFSEIFSVATAPIRQSFINLAEIELLKIILCKSQQTFKQHQQRWFWSKNNYYKSQVLDLAYFKKEANEWEKSGKNLNSELKKLEQTPEINIAKKQKLLKKYQLSPLLRTLLKISEDFTWWQDERKKSTYFNTHIGCAILREVGKRTGYTLHELEYAFPLEIENILTRGKPVRAEMKERIKNSAVVAIEGSFEVITGSKVERLRKIILGKKNYSGINDFRGLSASTGIVRGRVKIVKSVTEIYKVNKGDILVAVMTRPDYLMAMKKAAAIVTNEGGITSHAAIVSRELGIPCIIGTRIATEVLKDGDMVEVDANHGVVKKL